MVNNENIHISHLTHTEKIVFHEKHVHTCAYMYVITINEKEAISLTTRKTGHMGSFGGKKDNR